MTKQIDIKKLAPKMKPGYVACDKDGSWNWFPNEPRICYNSVRGSSWEDDSILHFRCIRLTDCFNIAPAEDWKNSLIKV